MVFLNLPCWRNQIHIPNWPAAVKWLYLHYISQLKEKNREIDPMITPCKQYFLSEVFL